MRRDVTGVLDMAMARIQGTIAIGLAITTIGVSFYALAASRRAAVADAAWLRQRLGEKRALVRALQADLAVVAETTERVSQMAAIARDQNVAVRRYAQVEEPRDARYTPARLAALDDETVHRSEDGARALAQLSFLEEQLAETTDSLALMTVLSKGAQREETMTPVAKVERKPERKAVRPAVAEVSAPGGWPVAGTISSGFGWRESPWGGGTRRHTGLDIRATYGAPVRVSAPGVVLFAGRDSGGYGTVVVVDHGRDLKTLYGHLSGVYVRPGQLVERGAVVGAVGNSGRATGVHLHYEVRVGNVPVDPMLYVRRADDPSKVASR
jgi:murein DD-endopeptidase MepM/ murein hydrolase activator NlpD